MILPGRALRFRLGKTPSEVDRALRFLVEQAYRTVAYHKEALDRAGLGPGDIRTARDLAKLPLMRKQVLLSAKTESLARSGLDLASAVRTVTSGSSGFPLTVYMSRAELTYQKLVLWRALRKYASLRVPLTIADVGSMVPRRKVSAVQRLGVAKVLRLPADLPVEEQAERLLAARPQLVEGFPSCLEVLAYELAERAATVRPRLVATRGEVLHGPVRELLERTFRCRVVDLYGCEEGGVIAYECPATPGRMHVNPATCCLEVVDEEGSPVEVGAEGTVLLANLFNLTMPLIRYELGDRAVSLGSGDTPCACGARGPVLGKILGRDDDLMLTPEGRKVSPRVPASLVFNALRSPTDARSLQAAVRRFQIVQEAPNLVVVRLLWGAEPDDSLRQRIEEAVGGMWADLECRTEDVTEIPLGPGGKFRKVIRAF